MEATAPPFPIPSSRPSTSQSRDTLGSRRHRSRTQVGSTNRPQTTPSPIRPRLGLTQGLEDGVEGPRRYSLLPEAPKRVHPLDQLFRDFPAFANNQEVPPRYRSEVSATWTHKVVPLPRDFKSETIASHVSQRGKAHPSDAILRTLEDKRLKFYKDTQERRLVAARLRLQSLARLKYGSLRDLFAAVRLDGKEVITLYDLSSAIRQASLEQYFPRSLQRLVFENVSGECYEKAPLEALLTMVDAPNQASGTRGRGSEATDDVSLRDYLLDGHGTKPITPASQPNKHGPEIPAATDGPSPTTAEGVGKEVQKKRVESESGDTGLVEPHEVVMINRAATHDAQADRTRGEVNRRLHQQCKDIKVSDDWPEDRAYLLNAFKQADVDMCGCLSVKEVEAALGQRGLKFGVEEGSLRHMLGVMARRHPLGHIQYHKLLDFLQLLRPEPNYNPSFGRREAVLKTTQDYHNSPFDWDPVLSAAVLENREAKFLGAIRLKREKEAQLEAALVAEEEELRTSAKNGRCMTEIRPEYLAFTVWDSLPTTQGRAKTAVHSSRELFQDMDDTNALKAQGICGRFSKKPPTDWTRVGYGGDGVDKNCAMYMGRRGQYTTTNATYYPRIIYQPNQPPRRRMLSDAERDAVKRQETVVVNRRIHGAHRKRIRESMVVELYDYKMKDDCRVKGKTSQALHYLEHAHRDDFFRDCKNGVMQKRGNAQARTHMFGGSSDQQFNIIQRSSSDARDFRSTYAADFLSAPTS